VLYSRAIFSSNSKDSLPENPLTFSLGQQDRGEGSSLGVETKSSPFLNPKLEKKKKLWVKGPDTNEETEGEESDATKVSDGLESAQTTNAPSVFIRVSTKATESVSLASRPRMEDTTPELGSGCETKLAGAGTSVEEEDPPDTSGIARIIPIISVGPTPSSIATSTFSSRGPRTGLEDWFSGAGNSEVRDREHYPLESSKTAGDFSEPLKSNAGDEPTSGRTIGSANRTLELGFGTFGTQRSLLFLFFLFLFFCP